MAYSKIIQLRGMRMAYSIKEEGVGDWKTFIVNDLFDGVLRDAIRAVRNNDADYHKPLWIAGTYGTGKSHAGAVLKHLLCDTVDDIREYVDAEYNKPQYETLRTSLYELRKEKRLFPVNMYGQQNIAHEDDLSLQLQREIKRALMAANLDITVQTDFDMYVQHIESQPQFWGNLIEQNVELKSDAPDLHKLKQRLRAGDAKVLHLVKSALRVGGFDIRLQSANLQQWIFEVQDALREKTDYCGLLIIWDEFTEVMTSSIGTRLLVQLQEIAEAMMNHENDSYFLLISHPSALNSLKEEEREKTKGRYNYETYNMEPVSAFKIMTKKFQVKNYTLYMQRQERFFDAHPEVLDMFKTSGSAENEAMIENIKDLFPLHPATANLAAYFAREAGSSSRSVFEFLACDAVRNFLESDELYDNGATITADYLWDYVQGFFESDTARFGAVTERYNSHHLSVENQGDNYLKAFKGILLLNALNNIANNDTVTPSTANIENLFIGTDVEPELEEILEFFNDKSIIQRQPNGNYSILFTALPGEEIQKIKEELKASSFLNTDQVINFGDTASRKFASNLTQVARPLTFRFFSMQANDYTLINRIENAKHKAQDYETFLAILVGRTGQEVMHLKDVAERTSADERFADVAFVVMDVPLGEREYERFIEYQANAQCAQKHGLPQQQQTYVSQASEMIDQWVRSMRSGNATFYLQGTSMAVAGSRLTSAINQSIAPTIFSSGPESLELIRTKSSATYWKKASVKSTVDAVLSYDNKPDILAKSIGAARHVEFLLQDSVDDNLEWKDTIDPEHPLKKVCEYVDEWLSGRHTSKNQPFNLGDKLIGLTKPPFGLFQSYAPMAMVAFAMRKYVNVIFGTDGKQLSPQHLVDVVVELFKAWESGKTSNKLNFVFESKEAGKVRKCLINMFNLRNLPGYSDISSLKDARWAVTHNFSGTKGYPMWSLKYIDGITDDMRTFIDNTMKVVTDSDSVKNPNLMKDMVDGYDRLKTDFGNLLLPSEDNFRKGFENFIMSIKVVDVEEDELSEAQQYLKENLEGTVGLWTEDEVQDHLKDWRMRKNKSYNPPADFSSAALLAETVSQPVSVSDSDLMSKREEALSRVARKAASVAELRQAIEEMIRHEDGSIIDTLLKYV